MVLSFVASIRVSSLIFMHGERRKMFREYYNTNVWIFVKFYKIN